MSYLEGFRKFVRQQGKPNELTADLRPTPRHVATIYTAYKLTSEGIDLWPKNILDARNYQIRVNATTDESREEFLANIALVQRVTRSPGLHGDEEHILRTYARYEDTYRNAMKDAKEETRRLRRNFRKR